MSEVRLVRVKRGFNTDLFEAFYYLEARLGKDHYWRVVVDGSDIVSFADKQSAETEAKALSERIRRIA